MKKNDPSVESLRSRYPGFYRKYGMSDYRRAVSRKAKRTAFLDRIKKYFEILFVFGVLFGGLAAFGGFLTYLSYENARSLNHKSAPTPFLSETSVVRINNWISNEGAPAFGSASELARHLVKPTDSDIVKAYAIYRWITASVSYDAAALESGDISASAKADYAFLKRKAVCQGYAELFLEMARAVGLEARLVLGHASDSLSERPLVRNSSEYENHAWNIVRIDGYWYPLDATWDAGFFYVGSSEFVRNTGEWVYFLADPQKFRADHEATVSNENLLPMPALSGTDYWWQQQLDGRTFWETAKEFSWDPIVTLNNIKVWIVSKTSQ